MQLGAVGIRQEERRVLGETFMPDMDDKVAVRPERLDDGTRIIGSGFDAIEYPLPSREVVILNINYY
ncbi:hypothetical protein NK8_43770 [Caballeronia sp. NK8]|nr:hypothetical protein NK8_43770 [Caballeronia sp. NK8]